VRGRGAEGILQRLEHELVRGVISDAKDEIERLRGRGALLLALTLARSAAAAGRARLLRRTRICLLEIVW